MASLTLHDAKNIATKGRPWTIRLECVDPGTNTEKFWFATGRGFHEAVECGWGRIGSKPQYVLTSFAKFEKKVHEKLAKGYRYAPTPYVRMTAKSLGIILGHSGPTPASTTYTASPVPTTKPTPIPVIPYNPGPHVWPAAPVSLPATLVTALPPLHVNTALPIPFGLIQWLKPTLTGWDALDSNQKKLLSVPFDSGKSMLRDFPAIITILT